MNTGANAESADRLCGQTSLSKAAANGHETVVKLLLDRGANIEAVVLVDGSSSKTPLLWTAKNEHKAVVKLLLDRGGNIEAVVVAAR